MQRGLKRADNDKAEEQRRRERQNNTCRACLKKKRRGGKRWVGCNCGAYWVCPACASGPDGSAGLVAHAGDCIYASSSDECDVSSVEGEESE